MRTDIKKDRKDLYLPGRADFTEVDVPAMTYLAIDGHGDPNTSPAYATAIQALYAGAYVIRAVLKKRTGDDFVVGPLEGLWTSADNAAFVAGASVTLAGDAPYAEPFDAAVWVPLPLPAAPFPAGESAGGV